MSTKTDRVVDSLRWEARYQCKGSNRWWTIGMFSRRADATAVARERRDNMTSAWVVDHWEDHSGKIVRPAL